MTEAEKPSNEPAPHRRTPVHLPLRQALNRSSIVFVTVCADNRRSLFARPEAHNTIKIAWSMADAWLVGRYILMPNHIHLFCAPGQAGCHSLAKWVQYWKALASKAWPWPVEQPIWQKSVWDTQLRTGERYSEKWEYVRFNPVRAELCTKPSD
jgi:putative transposase